MHPPLVLIVVKDVPDFHVLVKVGEGLQNAGYNALQCSIAKTTKKKSLLVIDVYALRIAVVKVLK